MTERTHFTLADARTTMATLRDMAPDGLRLPLTTEDVAAIMAAGVEVKGPVEGLVDFPTEIEGGEAYWCWQVEESELEWWHPRDTGFAGRRRIADLD